MCGRYTLTATADLVAEVFAAELSCELRPRWNVAPTEAAPVVRAAGDRRRLDLLSWGLVAQGSPQPGVTRHVNARSETVDRLAAFRDSFRRRRCLVPADGFYEWAAAGGKRRPFHVRFRDRRLFAMAGVWDPTPGDLARSAETFAILTVPPSAVVRPLHDRMPAILAEEAWEEWLRGDRPQDLLQLLRPWAGDDLEAVPVGSYVNRAGHEGSRCLEPPPHGDWQLELFSAGDAS